MVFPTANLTILILNNSRIFLLFASLILHLHPQLRLRGGAVAARWAHNPKVGGSNPPSATREDSSSFSVRSFSFIPSELLINCDFARKNEFTFEVRYNFG